MRPSSIDSALAERLRAGDRGAFDELVRLMWRDVMGFLFARVSAADAQDLAQGVFFSVYRLAREGRAPPCRTLDEWRRYLLASARNVWIDHHRHAHSAELVDDDLADAAADASPDHPVLAAELGRAMADCLDALDVRVRRMCMLHLVEGETKREVARRFGQPESTIRLSLTRALRSLRTCLEAKGLSPWATKPAESS
jgi:RNA polymerase sigma-70 factor (ECF subfamily)